MIEEPILPSIWTTAARQVWRRRAPLWLRRKAASVVAWSSLKSIARQSAQSTLPLHPGPLIVSGLINESLGLGRASALTIEALRKAGFAPQPHDIRPLLTPLANSSNVALPLTSGGVWILHCNAPEAARVIQAFWPKSLGCYRIGYWAWELERTPSSWKTIARMFHEIWVPSPFVAEALRAGGVDVPIRCMPHPVSISTTLDRRGQSASDDFTVLSMGDVRSSPERKNLDGAVEIYRKAFPAPSSRRRLIVKILQTDRSADFVSSLRAKVADRSDVQIIESDLNAEETTELMAGSSVLLSPHRSEGFGLAIAESLLLGVPALATGWSGNMVFMRDLPELQLKYTLVPVKDPYGVYAGRGLRWANPDIEGASERLRQLDAEGRTEAASALKYSAAVRHLEQYWTKSALSLQPWAALVNPGGHTGSL